MFFKKNKVEVVPESEWTDYSEHEKYATKKGLALAMCVPAAASVGLVAHRFLTNHTQATEQIANSVIDPATLQPVTSAITQPSTAIDPITVIPTGAVSDHVASTSLDVLTTIMDPILDILVALALPVASLLLVGACFFIMLGQKEKAYGIMMNTGIGYVLIQMSPLLLTLLKTAGSAVQPS